MALGHRYGVPVYPCINCPANFVLGGHNLRAAASNLWWAGADGIYLWNFHYIHGVQAPPRGRPATADYLKYLPEIADPQRLKYLDKTFAVNQRVIEQYQRASAMPPLPLSLGATAGEKLHVIPLRIGDDVATTHRVGRLRDVVLRLQSKGTASGDKLAIALNDMQSQTVAANAGEWVELPLKPQAIQQGVNQLKLTIAQRGEAAAEPLTIENVRVQVRYRPV